MTNGRWLGRAVACALAACSAQAEAAGVWMSSAPMLPVEQRIAVSAGPSRTTVWTTLRFVSAGGAVGIVLPAPMGASLDMTSDAWFEALEIATAPRVFPPLGAEAQCPDVVAAGAFEIAGDTAHTESLVPEEIAMLPDVSAVAGWAAKSGLVLDGSSFSALAAENGARFVALRFQAPAGPSVTKALRIAMPGAPARLPLSLLRAGAEDLRVTAWVIGHGRADLPTAAEVMLPSLAWRPEQAASDYEDRRDDVLAGDPGRFLVEAAGHALFVEPALGGAGKTESVIAGFFQRAEGYGDTGKDVDVCIANANVALGMSKQVAKSCPAGALGVVGSGGCIESPAAGEINPEWLRCGTGADDLAIALSGLHASSTWITRQSLLIGASEQGLSLPVETGGGQDASPGIVALMDLSQCQEPFFGDLEDDPLPAATPENGGGGGFVQTPTIETGPYESLSSGGESCDCDGEAAAAGAEACVEVVAAVAEASDGCSATGAKRTRTPRFSVLLLAALAVLVPLRRRGRRAR